MVVAAAGISAGGSLLGGLIGSSGAKDAAATNARAQQLAINAALQMQQNAFGAARYAWDQIRGLAPEFGARANQAAQDYYGLASGALNPYVQTGQTANRDLFSEIQRGALGQPPDMRDLRGLPGYQFTLDQGLKATQNAAAAQGLGISGAALKGATNYAENTADTFGNNYLQNYWANQNNRYQMLAGIQNTGLQAGAQLGTIAGGLGNTLASGYFGQGNQLTSSGAQLGAAAAGAATSAGQQIGTAATAGGLNVGNAQQNAANLLGSGIGGVGSNIGNALFLNSMMNNGRTIDPGSAYMQNPSFNIGQTP